MLQAAQGRRLSSWGQAGWVGRGWVRAGPWRESWSQVLGAPRVSESFITLIILKRQSEEVLTLL